LFHIDIHHTRACPQSDRWWRSRTSCQCSPTKQCNMRTFSSNLSFFLFHIDTHYTGSRQKSDQWQHNAMYPGKTGKLWETMSSCGIVPKTNCCATKEGCFSVMNIWLFRICWIYMLFMKTSNDSYCFLMYQKGY
jgi:hypothetical protein